MSIVHRIDRITKIDEAHYGTIIPTPKSVKIELTGKCDLRCFFCATSHNLRAKRDMDFNFYKRIVKEMRDEGVEELGLFYLGESLLYPQIIEAVKYAKDVCGYPYVFLTTNGRLADKDTVYELIYNGLDSLKFSFNSSSREDFKNNTGVDGYDKVVQNIKDARTERDNVRKEIGHNCGLYASSIKFSGDRYEKMQEAVKEIEPYVDMHYWLPLYNQAGFTKGARQLESKAGNIGRIGALREPIPCWSCFTEGHISWSGKLSSCCFDHNDTFDMGDLTKESFIKCWNSDKFQKLRQAHLDKNIIGTVCENCFK